MAGFYDKHNDNGTLSIVVQIRVRPYKPTSRTFNASDYPTKKDAQKAARAWAEAEERRLRDQKVQGAKVRTDFAQLKVADLAREYLNDPHTKALGTYDERAMQIAHWVNRHGSMRAVEFVNPLTLRAERDELSKTVSAGTVNRYLSAASAMIGFASAAGILPQSTMWPKKLKLREPKHRERFLTDAELARALEAARAESLAMYAAVLFAVGVGCRQSEQLRVRWSDVDTANGTVAIRVTKTDTSRRAHLPPAVIDALNALRAGKVRPMPSQPVFTIDGTPIPQHILVGTWERIRKVAKIPDVNWHDLRHSCASYLAQNGSSLHEIAAQLGHLNHATTRRYSHLIPGAAPTGAGKLNEKLRGATK